MLTIWYYFFWLRSISIKLQSFDCVQNDRSCLKNSLLKRLWVEFSSQRESTMEDHQSMLKLKKFTTLQFSPWKPIRDKTRSLLQLYSLYLRLYGAVVGWTWHDSDMPYHLRFKFKFWIPVATWLQKCDFQKLRGIFLQSTNYPARPIQLKSGCIMINWQCAELVKCRKMPLPL